MTTQSHDQIERRDIDGTGRRLGELFFNRRYAIDSYQREYKWQTTQLVDSLTTSFIFTIVSRNFPRTTALRLGHSSYPKSSGRNRCVDIPPFENARLRG